MTNPILAFGAKRRMRSIRTPMLLTLYALLLAALALLTVYSPFLKPYVRLGDMTSGVTGYQLMLILQFGLLLLVAPAITSGSISGERERQTLDLLLVTNTGAWQIVFGKLMESFAFLALMVLCALPAMSMVLLLGSVTFGQLMLSVLFLLVVAFAGLCVGLFCSTFMKRTVSATVMAYLMMLGIGVVTFVFLWYDVHQLDMIYRRINQAGQELPAIQYQAISFSTNPALGLLDLITVQLGVQHGWMYSYSMTLSATVNSLPFGRYLAANMSFMFAAGLALCTASALKLRVKKPGKRKGSVKQ